MFNKRNNENLLYYSVNTKLAYLINQKYYKEQHYLWCAPFFDEPTINIKTSNPRDLYCTLKKIIEDENITHNKIASTKVGLMKGAMEKYNQKSITSKEFDEIKQLVNKAKLEYFEPLLYIIPENDDTKKIFIEESNIVRSGVFSVEYVVENLPRDTFHVISY